MVGRNWKWFDLKTLLCSWFKTLAYTSSKVTIWCSKAIQRVIFWSDFEIITCELHRLSCKKPLKLKGFSKAAWFATCTFNLKKNKQCGNFNYLIAFNLTSLLEEILQIMAILTLFCACLWTIVLTQIGHVHMNLWDLWPLTFDLWSSKVLQN